MFDMQYDKPEKIQPPWSDNEVAALNRYQNSQYAHAFTCGNDRSDSIHQAYADYSRTEAGKLIATNSGWRCPACSYTQKWAWKLMLREPKNPFDRSFF